MFQKASNLAESTTSGAGLEGLDALGSFQARTDPGRSASGVYALERTVKWPPANPIVRSWLYPGLTREDILACLAYSSYLAHEYKAYPIPA